MIGQHLVLRKKVQGTSLVSSGYDFAFQHRGMQDQSLVGNLGSSRPGNQNQAML